MSARDLLQQIERTNAVKKFFELVESRFSNQSEMKNSLELMQRQLSRDHPVLEGGIIEVLSSFRHAMNRVRLWEDLRQSPALHSILLSWIEEEKKRAKAAIIVAARRSLLPEDADIEDQTIIDAFSALA